MILFVASYVARMRQPAVQKMKLKDALQVWHASDKKEHAARTIRPKIQKQMPKFLEQFPELPAMPAWDGEPPSIDWASIIAEVTERGTHLHT